ncbi:MAG: hypothetical protein ABW034_04345 [Steroidobacteraceae bacterium]
MTNMRRRQGMPAARIGRIGSRRSLLTALVSAVLGVASINAHAQATPERAQAKRLHDRLVGTPPSAPTLNQMESMIDGGDVRGAAEYAIDRTRPESSPFYNVVLKNFATPWTNRDRNVFAPLNDYTATIIGLVRDDSDFRTALYDDVVYVGQGGTYSPTSNTHYENLEATAADLRTVLQRTTQSSVSGIPAAATAGVITSRAASEAFFIDGTNRAMFRFTLLNHLCRDMEQVQNTSYPPDRIRQDVTRSPGGDSRLFLNGCVGCHSGMDPMAQAFSYYDFDETQGRLVYTPGAVQPKYLINSDNFKPGFVTPNDNWENRWRTGANASLGWAPSGGSGQGAKSLGQELANSDAFADCQVDKVFRQICFRQPTNGERTTALNAFRTSGYSLRSVFVEAAVACSTPSP